MSIKISMTDFMEFVIRAGTPKATVVREVKQRHAVGYDPMTDFYKKLRDGIVATHEKSLPRTNLDRILAGLSDPKKIKTYPDLVSAYKSFLGRKALSWFAPPKSNWQHSNLIISVNPELGLEINGVRHAVKLYFKAAKPTKVKMATALHLLRLRVSSTMEASILDVRRGKLITQTAPVSPTDLALLQGEALSFETLYAAV